MASSTIPNMPPAGPLDGTEEVPISQVGVNKKTTTQDIADLAAGGGGVQSVVAGTNITVDATDPANPIVSASGGGGSVTTVLTGNDLQTLLSDPPVLLAGVMGKTNLVTSMVAQAALNGGTFPDLGLAIVRYAGTDAISSYAYTTGFTFFKTLTNNADSPVSGIATGVVPLGASNSATGHPLLPMSTSSDPDYIGLDIVLSSNINPDFGSGPIATYVITPDSSSSFAPGDQFTVDGGSPLAGITVDTVTNSFPITSVNTGTKTFVVTGDLSAATSFGVYGSTGNDGIYTIVSAVFATGSTTVVVSEAVPDATVDGYGYDGATNGGVIATSHMTSPGDGYSIGDGVSITPVTGIGFATVDIQSVTNNSPVTITVVTNYTQI